MGYRSELLLPGQDWKKEIDNAIKASVALIVIMTPNARQSEYVTYEWAFAVGRGLPVIPIMLKKTDLHPRLNDVQYIDFTNAWGDADSNWNKLLMSLNIEVSKKDNEKIPNAIARAIQDLDSSDERQRLGALETLRNSYPHPSAKMGLINALSHVTTDVRQISIQLLEKLEDKDSAIYIAEKLNDIDVKVRQDAVKALQVLKVEKTIPHLFQAHHDEKNDDYIKLIALETLFVMEQDIVTPYLVQLLENTQMAYKTRDEILRTFTKWRLESVSNTMISLFQDDNRNIRFQALKYFQTVRDSEALPAIIGLLDSKEFDGRSLVIRVLAQYKDEIIIEVFMKMWDKVEGKNRETIIASLGKFDNKEANELTLSGFHLLDLIGTP